MKRSMKKLSEKQHKENIRQFIKDKNKLRAVAYIRKITGTSIKESKELCESFIKNLSKLDDYKFKITNKNIHDSGLRNKYKISHELKNKIEIYLTNGQKLEAIKCVYNDLETSLKEAKEIIDSFKITSPGTERNISTEDQSVSPDL